MSLFGGIELVDRPDPENIRKLDLLQIPVISQMQRYGIRLDMDRVASLSDRLGRRMADLRADIVNEIPPDKLDSFVDFPEEDEENDEPIESKFDFSVDSSEQVGKLLFDLMGVHLDSDVQVKRTRGGKISTGKKTLEQFKREFPIVRLILEYREYAKLKGTYIDAMPRRARFHPKGPNCPVCGRRHWTDERRVHSTITTTRCASGRIASKAPNLANIPARTSLGREIRECFISSEGYVIAQRDWSQIELRLLADLSGDPTMMKIYRDDGDIHIATAMGTFNITNPKLIDKLTHRAPAKNVNFAVAYRITGTGLLDLMAVSYAAANQPLPEWMTEEWCDEFIEKWYGLYPLVRKYLNAEEEKIRRYGMAWTRCGRVRRVPEARSYLGYVQEAGVRQGSNHAIQGFNADLAKLAMGAMHERLEQLREYYVEAYPLMHIYDEFLVETTEDHGETIEIALGDIMDSVLRDMSSGVTLCKVPIKSDGKLMKRWIKE